MALSTKCPQCNKTLWFSRKIAGSMSICPACGMKVLLEVPLSPKNSKTAESEESEGAAPYELAATEPPPHQQNPAIEQPAEYVEQEQPSQEWSEEVSPDSVQNESDLVSWAAPGNPAAAGGRATPTSLTPAPAAGGSRLTPSSPQSDAAITSVLLGQRGGVRVRGQGPDMPVGRARSGPGGSMGKWIAIGAAAILLLIGGVWLLEHSLPGSWEQAHRQDVLSLKQNAEDMALNGKYREAYDKYQELERLVAGQKIEDPYLSGELDKAWKRRDELYELAMKETRSGPDSETAVVTPKTTAAPTAPAVPTTHANPTGIPTVPAPATKPYVPPVVVVVPKSETAPPPPKFHAPPSPPPAIVPAHPDATKPAAPRTTPPGPGSATGPPIAQVHPSPSPGPPAPAVATGNPSATTRGFIPPAPVVSTYPAPAAVALSPSLPGKRPAAHRMEIPPGDITDAQIGTAIEKGAGFLIQQFNSSNLTQGVNQYEGLDALSVYALMQAGLATHDKRLDMHEQFMRNAVEALKKLSMRDHFQTYARALRATALALYDRPEDHETIRQDVNWLLHAQYGGAFTYDDAFVRSAQYNFWDNSNSQYGLLGVWSGAEVGVEVPSQFWRDVEQHWKTDQMADGEWHYRQLDTDPKLSMTFAGIASLFVTQDYLDPVDWGSKVGRPPFSDQLAKSLSWLETGDNGVIKDYTTFFNYYTIYGLERAGLASGFKFFGSHDWYRQTAIQLLAQQNLDGSWGQGGGPIDQPGRINEPIVNSSYALLFLARGRHPLIMNKLRFDGYWANRPRDLANLARFASAELERPLNWQVVPVDHDWHDWTDSRILYIASHQAPRLTSEDRQKLKKYVQSGGMLLLQSDGGSQEFTEFATQLGQELFPRYAWTDLPDDSPVYSVSYRISQHPKIRVITNGSRILMMHWPTDLSINWQLRKQSTGRSIFELGVNLVLYAAGKGDLRNRLQTQELPNEKAPAASLPLGRVSYNGNWDPEPAAWPRAQQWFRQRTGLDFTPQEIPLEKLAAANPPIAHLTGTDKVNFSADQIQSVRNYVKSGGVLVIDPCGMPGDFFTSVRDGLLAEAFPSQDPQPVDQTSPMLLEGDGMEDVSNPAVRDYVRTLNDVIDPHPMMIKAGLGHVIVLPLDLTSGLLGADTWGIAGYKPDYALSLMKNIIVWTWDGAKDQ